MLTAIAIFLLTHQLSPAEYGTGMLFISTFKLLFYICGSGMGQALMRYFYEPKYLNQTSLLLYRCLFFVMVNSLIVLVIFWIFRDYIAQFFGLSPLIVLVSLMLGGLLMIVFDLAGAIPRLLEKPVIYGAGQALQQFFYLAFVILLLFFWHKNNLVIVYSELLSLVFAIVGLIYIYKKFWAIPSKLLQKLHFSDTKELLHYGFPFVLASGLDWIFFNLDKFLLLKWSNAYELGIYTAAFFLASPLVLFQTVFTTAWLPRVNQVLIQQSFRAPKIFNDTFHRALWVLTAATLIMLCLKDILMFLLGSAFHDAQYIFGWLLFMPYFATLGEIINVGIIKSKKTYWHIVIALVCVAANVIGCYFLIPRWGATGAAISNAISFAVFFLMRQWIAFRYYPFRVNHWRVVFYVVYLCGVAWISMQNNSYEILACMAFFVLFSLVFEYSWLKVYIRKIRHWKK